MKEETKKRKEQLKKKFSDLYATTRTDENGKKLSKTEQNKLVLKKLNEQKEEKLCIGDIEYNNDSRVKSKYNYRIVVNDHYFSKEMNKEIVQTIETDV